SSPSSRPSMVVSPTASAPNIRARCEMDLSPGSRTEPESAEPGLAVIGFTGTNFLVWRDGGCRTGSIWPAGALAIPRQLPFDSDARSWQLPRPTDEPCDLGGP